MPQPSGRRPSRRLFRWHPAKSTRAGLSFAAVAIALTMVGAVIVQSGIAARAPNGSLAPDPQAGAATRLPTPAAIGSDLGVSGMLAPPPGLALTIPQDPPSYRPRLILHFPYIPRKRAVVVAETPPSRPRHQKPPPPHPAPPQDPSTWNVAPIVTWYGPGFYGKRTACGQRYSRTIIGVAHKTLPCGTLIQFRWHGITALARVIDRGPYATSDYVFDFSAALACDVFQPAGVENACFTRHDVQWRIVGRRAT